MYFKGHPVEYDQHCPNMLTTLFNWSSPRQRSVSQISPAYMVLTITKTTPKLQRKMMQKNENACFVLNKDPKSFVTHWKCKTIKVMAGPFYIYIYALKFDISNATSEQGTNHEDHKQVYPGMNQPWSKHFASLTQGPTKVAYCQNKRWIRKVWWSIRLPYCLALVIFTKWRLSCQHYNNLNVYGFLKCNQCCKHSIQTFWFLERFMAKEENCFELHKKFKRNDRIDK